MKGKILLVVGLGVGYVLGARAGRERYDEIMRAAGKFWNDPRVKKAEEFVKDKAPDVAEFLSDSAKKVASQVSGAKKPATRPAARKSPTTRPSAPKN